MLSCDQRDLSGAAYRPQARISYMLVNLIAILVIAAREGWSLAYAAAATVPTALLACAPPKPMHYRGIR
jgi:hypothetical protein